jgi:hypothetical protein
LKSGDTLLFSVCPKYVKKYIEDDEKDNTYCTNCKNPTILTMFFEVYKYKEKYNQLSQQFLILIF